MWSRNASRALFSAGTQKTISLASTWNLDQSDSDWSGFRLTLWTPFFVCSLKCAKWAFRPATKQAVVFCKKSLDCSTPPHPSRVLLCSYPSRVRALLFTKIRLLRAYRLLFLASSAKSFATRAKASLRGLLHFSFRRSLVVLFTKAFLVCGCRPLFPSRQWYWAAAVRFGVEATG